MNVLPDAIRLLFSQGSARLRAGLSDLPVVCLIGICLLTSGGFALAAAYHLLRPLIGPAGASAVLAVVLLIAAVGLMLFLSVRRAGRKSSVASPSPAPAATPAPDPGVAPTPAVADLGTQAAFLAGFLLARRW